MIKWRSPWVWANPIAWMIIFVLVLVWGLTTLVEKMQETGLVEEDD